MANPAENVAKLKDAYRRWDQSKGKDTSMWTSLFSEHVRLRSLAAGKPGLEFTMDCHSASDIARYFSGLAKDWHVPGYPEGKSLVPHGMAVVLNNPSVWRFTAPCCPERHLHGARCLGAKAEGANAGDAGEVLAARVIELMRATAMPNGLGALGFDDRQVAALATGAEPQYRVIRNAPKDVGRGDLEALFRAALSYW